MPKKSLKKPLENSESKPKHNHSNDTAYEPEYDEFDEYFDLPTIENDSNKAHNHTHTHIHTRAVLNRMSRLIGHLESTKRMIEAGRDCSEILIQLSAVSSAIKGVSRIILKDHLEHCMVEAVRTNDRESLENLNNAIDRFLK